MPFQVPPSKASIKQNRFEFIFLDGKDYSVPLLKFLNPGLLEELSETRRSESVRRLLEFYEPGLFEQFDDMEQVKEFYEAWAKASGMELGESSASPSSSASTEGPSATTSSPSASALTI